MWDIQTDQGTRGGLEWQHSSGSQCGILLSLRGPVDQGWKFEPSWSCEAYSSERRENYLTTYRRALYDREKRPKTEKFGTYPQAGDLQFRIVRENEK